MSDTPKTGPRMNLEPSANYQGQAPTNANAILHDAVVGTEIVVWFDTVNGPIGIGMCDDIAKELRNRLIDLIDNIE
jgi:hypothetical protein